MLAGDHLKASSDLGVPLVGVGLLYTEGYFRQRLDAEGWQQESVAEFTPLSLGLVDTDVEITVDLAGDPVRVHVWRSDVGRVPLYLLDTDVEGNSPEGVAVTDRLYGGDVHHRLRQEIVLGIGGVRALRALAIDPEVFHTNEGHAGFLGLERVREHTGTGLPFAAAIEAVRGGGVFTTHTPVAAGIDRFPRAMMERYFTAFATECGVSFDELFALGKEPDAAEPPPGAEDGNDAEPSFNMAVMGLRLAARSNGVARLHGETSRQLFHRLWPDLAVDEVPIGSITNGVHGRSWVSPRVDALLTRVVGDDWPGADAERWARVGEIDPAEAWATLNDGRDELVRLARQRLGTDVLDGRTLTIGFARRFATYKRATLLLSDQDRLRALLHDADRPVQFVFAGKAHPADTPGKQLIQQIEQFARQAGVRSRFVFLADYDISIATRAMYVGCDVWLNTPRRPYEACGTSGMKAALNGALNCSILDGWWAEQFDGSNGWAIESAENDPDEERPRPARRRACSRSSRTRWSGSSTHATPMASAGVGRDGAQGVGVARTEGHLRPDGPRLHHCAVRTGSGLVTPSRRRRRQAGHRAGELAAPGRGCVGRRRRDGGRRRRHRRLGRSQLAGAREGGPRRTVPGRRRRRDRPRPARPRRRVPARLGDGRAAARRQRRVHGRGRRRRRRLLRRHGADHPGAPRPGQPVRRRSRRPGPDQPFCPRKSARNGRFARTERGLRALRAIRPG